MLRPAAPLSAILLFIMLLPACAPESRTDSEAPAQDQSAAALPGTQKRFSAEDEALHLARFNRLMDPSQPARGKDLYDPLAPLPGAGVPEPLPQVAAGDGSIRSDALEAAQSYAAEMNSNALLIWRDGVLELEAYFGEHTRDSLVVSGSLAKPLTAIAVGRALALGHIESLDQPVADYINEWQGDALREKMRVRHLLDMRSGFLPQGNSADPQHVLNRAYLHPRHDEVIIHDYPVVDEPGSRHEYSNATSELVAVVIQRATGMRYEDFVAEEVLRPIGAAGGQIWLNRPDGVAHSGCCALLPAQSWLRLAMLLLDDGVWEGTRLLPEGYVAEMKTGTAQNQRYGLGVYLPGRYTERRAFANLERHPELGPGVLHTAPYLADDLFMFDGNANQVVYIVPSLRLIILRTGGNPPRDNEWDNSYLPNLLIANTVLGPNETLPEPQPVAQEPIGTNTKRADAIEYRIVKGAGGVPLHVAEAGPRDAPGVLFVHGATMSSNSWQAQLESSLADKLHLVAYDMRGHGNSGKPWNASDYADSKLWADDFAAVLDATGLQRPVVVAWSYGGHVTLDFLRHYPASRIAGIVFVGSSAGMLPFPPPDAATAAEFARLGQLAMSPDAGERLAAARGFVTGMAQVPLPKAVLEREVASVLAITPLTRQVMYGRPLDNSDLIDSLTMPVLFMLGEAERTVTPAGISSLLEQMPDARMMLFPATGHMPFIERRERFNAELTAFTDAIHRPVTPGLPATGADTGR